jgi:hypothetical protein
MDLFRSDYRIAAEAAVVHHIGEFQWYVNASDLSYDTRHDL